MIRITIGDRSFVEPSLDDASEACRNAMILCYMTGDRPEIVAIESSAPVAPVVAPPALRLVTPAAPIGDLPFPDAAQSVRAAGPFGLAVDRIAAQRAALGAAGVNLPAASRTMGGTPGVSYKDQSSYSTRAQESKRVEHERKMPLVDVAHALNAAIQAEHREDVELSAAELSRSIHVNGKITVGGRALTEQAIRGLAARLESPMLGYVLGLRDRIAGQPKHMGVQADRERIAEVLRHECARNPDVKLQLRTRNGGTDDVYACVSPSYVPADATMILPEILEALSPDTRATFAYDPASTQWEIRASVWTPTPTEEQAVGEAFEGFVSLRSRDNGTSKFRADGGVNILICLNAASYNAGGASVSRVHRGRVMRDVDAMISTATTSISALVAAWGAARAEEIPMSAEEKASGDKFLSAMWLDMLKAKPLEGVLVGRKSDHVSGLLSAYHAERRDADRLVRADMAQGWTRYIQGQPADVRRDAEAAIGSWLVAR